MSNSGSFSFQPLRYQPVYASVSTNDSVKLFPKDSDLEVSSLSKQERQDRDWRDTSMDHRQMTEDEEVYESGLCSVLRKVKKTFGHLKSRLPTGWRFGAWLAVFQASAVLFANIIILLWSTLKSGGSINGIVFRDSNCHRVDQYSTGIHLLINVLSTLLLGASNYMMQTLCAPTRDEVDSAHEKGVWLDIGLQSIRNLKYTSRRKRRLWILLSISSIPLHLFYNSSFFTTISDNSYEIYPTFGPDLQTSPHIANDRYNWRCGYLGCPANVSEEELSRWDVLSPSECIHAYASDIVSDRGMVIPIVGDYVSNGTLIAGGKLAVGDWVADAYSWICSGMDSFNARTTRCSTVMKNLDSSHWKIKDAYYSGSIANEAIQVHYCLSQPVVPDCQLNFNLPLLSSVIVFNIVKLLCIIYTALKIKDDALVTVGDAITSFTSNPDIHTRGMCLASNKHFDGQNKGNSNFAPLCLQYHPQRIRWFNAASRRHWISTILFFVGATSVIVGLLVYGLVELKLDGVVGFASLWQYGIGKYHIGNIIDGQGWYIPPVGYIGLLASVLISNSPQLILSSIYLFFNSVWTKMFIAREWSLYAHSRKPLRVSSPQGDQRSTYFLQIPYRFGLPLMAYMALLHWLLSQSIFLVQMNSYWYARDNSPDFPYITSSSCGYSPVGLILTVIVSMTLILGTFIIGFFTRLRGDMPFVGSCSAAISASCHPPPTGADSLKALKWGAVAAAQGDGEHGHVGHTCFSSGDVLDPIPGHYYS